MASWVTDALKTLLKRYPPVRSGTLRLRSVLRSLVISYRTHPAIIGRIHYDDASFDPQAPEHYARVSEQAVAIMERSLRLAGRSFDDVDACLDMACGFGRVLRVLATRVSPDKIDACDVDERAVSFCCSELGARPVVSSIDFGSLELPRPYDLVWVGSLLTHLPEKSFRQALAALCGALKEDGVLVLTTHGIHSLGIIDSYGARTHESAVVDKIVHERGFYFAPYPGDESYGICVSTRAFVLAAVNKSCASLELIEYVERGWDDHQDTFAFQRTQ